MKTHFTLNRPLVLGLTALLLLFNVGLAQDFRTSYQNAMQAAQSGDFAKSAKVFAQCFKNNSPDLVIEDNGGLAGAAFFDYARILIQTRNFEEAKKWLNLSIGADARAAKISPIKKKNPSANQSRFQLAFVEAQLGNHAQALKLYKAYKDIPKSDAEWVRNRGSYMLYTGTSQIKSGAPAAGAATINQLFTRRDEWGVQPPVLMQGLLVLGEGWASQAKAAGDDAGKIKEVENSAHQFLDANLSYVTASPFVAYRLGFIDRFKKLGFDCATSNLYSVAIRVFSQVPTVEEIKEDLAFELAKANPLAGVDAKAQAFSDRIDAMEKSEVHPDIENYRVIATCYERMGNPSAAREIHRFLAQNYPALPAGRRAEILHEAARFSTIEGDTNAARYFGDLFFAEIPKDNPLRSNVSSFTLQSLISSRKFEEAIQVCKSVRGQYKLGEKERELADAYLPISLFALKRHQEAAEPFSEYMSSYPNGDNRETVAYQRALNSINLGKFRSSADQLDDFLQEFGDSDRFKEGALANLATSRYNLEDYAVVIKTVDQLEEYKPDSVEMARTLITRGDAYMVTADRLANERKDEKAAMKQKGLESYLAATEAALNAGKVSPDNANYFKEVAGQSIWNAFEYYDSNDQPDKALAKYDEFFPEYKGTQFEPKISVFGLEVLAANKRGEEGLRQVEDVINFVGNLPPEKQDPSFLQKAIGSYSKASIEIRGEDATIKTLDDFPNINKQNQALLTWLKMQKVVVLQNLRNKNKRDTPEYASFVKRIEGVFEEMANYDIKSMSSFAVQQIGNNFSKGENPFRAVPYYEELLGRDDGTFKGPAEFGLAAINMRKAGKEAEAKSKFLKFLNNDGYKRANPELIPEAHLNLAKIYIGQQNWADATAQLSIINKNPNYFKKDRVRRAECGLLFGNVLREKGDALAAVKSYLSVTNTYINYTQHSTEAFFQYSKIALDTVKNAPEIDEKQITKRQKEKNLYGIYLEYLYRWRKLDARKDSPTGALNSLRRSVENFQSDLKITKEDETEIRNNSGIPLDWNPSI